MFIIGLTMSAYFGCFVDKEHISLKISCVNVPELNFLLRLEIFVSEDRQLRSAHLILGYEPLSRIYQDVRQALRAGNPCLARIDVSKPYEARSTSHGITCLAKPSAICSTASTSSFCSRTNNGRSSLLLTIVI